MRIKKDTHDTIFLTLTILGLVVIGIVTMLLIRVQRGLLGFILAALAVALLSFWLKEIRKTVKEELLPVKPSSKTEWVYDVVDHGTELTVIAEVPGPESEVKASLNDHNLEILGGQGFRKLVKLLGEVEITETTYHNGVLQVKLRRRTNAKQTLSCLKNLLTT